MMNGYDRHDNSRQERRKAESAGETAAERSSPPGTVCFFNTARAWGGGEKWHYDMASLIDRKRWRAIAVADRAGELYSRLARVDIPLFGVTAGNLSFMNPFKVRRIRDLLIREKVDTLIMNLPSDLKLAAPAARSAGVRNIVYRRGSAIPVRNNMLNRILYGRCLTSVIANSIATKETILRNNPSLFDENRIEVIYNGIDLGEWDNSAGQRIYQAQPGETVIGNAGRIVSQKGQKYLVDLAAILEEKGLDFRILIAGKGRLKKRIEEYAESLGVSGRIVFTGFSRNIKSFMESIDLFVLTSLWEGFGYVLVEAMASKKPVIAFAHSSNPEVVEDGRSGFLVPFADMESMATHIIRLAGDPEERNSLGRNARRIVEERFTIRSAVSNLESFLDDPVHIRKR